MSPMRVHEINNNSYQGHAGKVPSVIIARDLLIKKVFK